jgi:hypothetical protein
MGLLNAASAFYKRVFIITVIGIFIASTGYASWFLVFGIEVQGQVTRIQRIHSSGKAGNYDRTWVEFLSSSNQTYETFTDSNFNLEHYTIGESVPILYMKDNPNQAEVKSFLSLFGFASKCFLLFFSTWLYLNIKKKYFEKESDDT